MTNERKWRFLAVSAGEEPSSHRSIYQAWSAAWRRRNRGHQQVEIVATDGAATLRFPIEREGQLSVASIAIAIYEHEHPEVKA